MSRYVAFLRGLNVGGHRVKMERLRAIFEEMGFDGVWTFIASGNVVFETEQRDAAELERRIAAELEEALGYAVPAFVRTPVEVARAAHPELAATDDPAWHIHVAFLAEPVDEALEARFSALEGDGDRFDFGEREVYWSVRGKMSESPLFGTNAIDKAMARPHTVRKTTSLARLAAKLDVAP